MTDEQVERTKLARPSQSAGRKWIVTVIGFALLLTVPAAPTLLEAMTSFKSAPGPEIHVDCRGPMMHVAPTFSTNPKGSASYPFGMVCYAAEGGSASMDFHFEGRWNPSETRPDRPNAVETLNISGYERFLPNRKPKGTIFLYWTARCTADPWLQSGACARTGAYVPDDIRAAFPEIDFRQFPLTGNSISVPMKQALITQYQAANTPVSTKSRIEAQANQQIKAIQPQQSQAITQAQRDLAMTALPKPNTAASSLARSGILARGVEGKEGQPSGPQDRDAQPEIVETSDMAVLEEGVPEIVDPVALHLDRVVYTLTATPEAIVLKPGVYEVGIIMGLQLALAKEGQATVLLNTQQGTHTESITRNMALVVPGRSDDVHLVFLTPDGRRFDAIGTTSGVMSRGTDIATAVPNERLTQAVLAASTKPRSVSSPACQPNPADIGPRWIPVPCTLPTAQSAPPGGRP